MKFFFAAFLLFVVTAVNAQRNAKVFHPSANLISSGASVRNFIDTIKPLSFVPVNEGGLGCFTGYYNSPDSGYVSGNNSYGDLEKAQFFSLTQMGFAKNALVQNVLVRFSYKALGPQPEYIYARIYDCDSGLIVPRNLLSTTSGIVLSTIQANGEGILFTFPEPVAVTDSFFISVQLPAFGGDTIVIQSTDDDCVSQKGWSWEMWDNGTWHSIVNSWVLNIDLAIFPVAEVETLSGISRVNNSRLSVFPNPASDRCIISVAHPSSDSRILLEDLSGRVVSDLGKVKNENTLLNLTSAPDGFYFILVQNESGFARTQLCILH